MTTTTPAPLLSAHSLTCIREERILFDELSFDIHPGDIVQVEGPNGAGKTSLLRLLTGLANPYSGKVCFRGQVISAVRDEFHADLLYLGHLPGVKSELTAEENLDFNFKISGQLDAPVSSTLAQVNLTGFEDHPAGHLSAGQHRRIALARLWHTDATIWILDEPLTAIDKKGVQRLEELFLQHADRGGCVVLTTHQDLHQIKGERLRRLTLDYQFAMDEPA